VHCYQGRSSIIASGHAVGQYEGINHFLIN
jgi:hypothetical protein